MSVCVVSLDYLCRWQVHASVYSARRIHVHFTVFNPVAPYRYLLATVYLSVTDIVNPDLFACCRTWTSLNIARFYEEQCQPSSMTC